MPVHDKDGYRRALVHGEKDQLVVNCESDYHHTEIHGALDLRNRAKLHPSMITMRDDLAGGATTAMVFRGELRAIRDVLVPLDGRVVTDTSNLDGYKDSVAHTLRWVMQRLDAIERRVAELDRRAGIQSPPPPARPAAPDGGG